MAFYIWSVWINPLFRMVVEILSLKDIGPWPGPFRVTLRHRSLSILHGFWDIQPQRYWSHDLDHLGSRNIIGQMTIGVATYWFPISDQFKLTTYLARFPKYSFQNFGVMTFWTVGLSLFLYFATNLISRVVAEICCVKHLAKRIPIKNALIPVFVFLGAK